MQGKVSKVLTPKKMLQRWPIGLAQVKADSTPEHVLNYIHPILYLLHGTKEITENVYDNVINLIEV